MAKKNLKSVSLVITYENGVNSKGSMTYKKKTYSNVKTTADADSIYAVADGIKNIMTENIKSISVSESSDIINE